MKNKFLQIKQAIDAGAYLPALALSLTLPDICGQIEYPDLYNERHGKKFRNGKEQYIKWYDEYVKPICFIPGNDAPENQFDGAMCYALRCAFLHAGNFELKEQNEKTPVDIFRLHVNKAKGIHYIFDSYFIKDNKRTVDLDAYGLCYYIFKAVHNYYVNHENKEDFEKYDPVIIDSSWSDEDFDKIFTTL